MDDLKGEALAILGAAGGTGARVEQDSNGWLVAARFGSAQHVGHTGIDPLTSGDPRDMARRLVVIAAGEAPMGIDHAAPVQPVEDEDPGEQPEIFTEEDVEALGAVAVESEASDSAADDTASDDPARGGPDDLGRVLGDDSTGPGLSIQESASDSGGAASPAYPGVALLPDELGARRNAVLAAIATEKLTRLSIAMDPSRADFLAARFADYQNAGALGLAIDDALLADRDAFLAMKDRTDRITAYALSLERAAIEADSDMLSAMHAGLGDGWP